MTIMTCVWNGNLYGWGVNRSNKHSQKQFLHPHHWIQIPKSRQCNKHMWFVVILRIGPHAASLNRLIHLLWMTIATSHSTTKTCMQLNSQLQNNSTFFTFEEACTEDMCPQIKGHASLLYNSLDTSSTAWTNSSWWSWILIWTQKIMDIASFSDSTHLTYITKILHHG